MRADNSQFIIDAAKRRRADALGRARVVLDQALNDGEAMTVSRLAARANVSRSWLYAEPTLRVDLVKVTAGSTTTNRRRSALVESVHPASEASLRTRLDIALDRARRLEAENRELREQLARALGQQRHNRLLDGPSRSILVPLGSS